MKKKEEENIDKLAKTLQDLELSSSEDEYWDYELPIILKCDEKKPITKEFSHFTFGDSSEDEMDKLSTAFITELSSSLGSLEEEKETLLEPVVFSSSTGHISGGFNKITHPLDYIGAYKELKIPKYAPNLFNWHSSVTKDYFDHLNKI